MNKRNTRKSYYKQRRRKEERQRKDGSSSVTASLPEKPKRAGTFEITQQIEPAPQAATTITLTQRRSDAVIAVLQQNSNQPLNASEIMEAVKNRDPSLGHNLTPNLLRTVLYHDPRIHRQRRGYFEILSE